MEFARSWLFSPFVVGSPITSSPAHTFTDEERFGAYSWTNDMPSAKETTITTFLAETCPLPEGQPMPIVQVGGVGGVCGCI